MDCLSCAETLKKGVKIAVGLCGNDVAVGKAEVGSDNFKVNGAGIALFNHFANVALEVYDSGSADLLEGSSGVLESVGAVAYVDMLHCGKNGGKGVFGFLACAENVAGVHIDAEVGVGESFDEAESCWRVVYGCAYVSLNAKVDLIAFGKTCQAFHVGDAVF